VEDDVEGTVDELLWKTAFQTHPYHWPTIGWMDDIEGFSTEDCDAFYRDYYAPNNASLIVVGDLNEKNVLSLVSSAYGDIPRSTLPLEDSYPEPPQAEERRVEIAQPTPTQKAVIGYKGPALGDHDHVAVALLVEILTGSAASRIRRRLIRTQKIASDVGGFVGPHAHPSLIEVSASARESHTAEELLAVIDEEVERVSNEPVDSEELERARNRMELGLFSNMETADGKASTIGFHQCVVGQPDGAIKRLEQAARVTKSDILRVARRYFKKDSRTVIFVRPKENDQA
jgi:zinc protease